MTDFYQVLGIPKEATAAQVREAYVRLARERHPDRFPDPAKKLEAQEFFKNLTEAFNTLSNPRHREQYDAERERPRITAPEEIAADAHRRAVQKFKEKDFHEAVTLLRTAVHHAPSVSRYHADLARALSQNPHWMREALEEMEAASKLEPRNPGYHAELASLFLNQGLKIRARKCIETALALAPGNATFQQMAADLGASGEGDDSSGKSSGGLLDRFRRKP